MMRAFLEFLLFLLSVVLLPACIAQEGSTCNLPNSSMQSTCVRLHRCNSFWEIVRSTNGKPSAADKENFQRHTCGSNVLCCPDNAVAAPITAAPITAVPQPAAALTLTNGIVLPQLNNLNQIKLHRNINLINEKKCGTSSTNRIVGGSEADLGEFPWMALLQFKSRLGDSLSFGCGGTLVSPFFVVTAAHCVNRDLVAVRLGEHKISTAIDCDFDNSCQDPVQDIAIEKATKHSNYSNYKKINDIAILRLKTAADVTKRNVKTICLPTSADNQIGVIGKEVREKMAITGWGKIESGKASDVLMRAFVPFVKNEECSTKFAEANLPIYETYLCAGGKNKTDTCNGDSGGPIQTFGPINGKPRMILYGVVSVGVQCLNPETIYPGIYTNIAYYLDWILDNMS